MGLVGVQVDGGRRQQGVPQVVADGGEVDASPERQCRVRIQCGLARRSISATTGFCCCSNSATCVKNPLTTTHSLRAVMPAALSCSKLATSGVRGSHRAIVVDRRR